MDDVTWRDFSACRDQDPELFFPVGAGELARRQIAAAKAVCIRCVVKDDCLDWALDHGEQFGVWGALDEDERRVLLRRGWSSGRVGAGVAAGIAAGQAAKSAAPDPTRK